MRKLFTFFMLSLITLGTFNLNAETTLTQGDVVIVGMNSDKNSAEKKTFYFVPLVDLEAGTVINFTDAPYTGTELKNSEGVWTYTVSSKITAGTVIACNDEKTNGWSKSGSFNMSASGDNILVFQGTKESPTFIYGIGWARGASWITEGEVSPKDSYVPSSLSEANHTVVNLGAKDNYHYTGSTTGTKEEILANLANTDNWEGHNTTTFEVTENFTVSKNPNSVEENKLNSADVWVSNNAINVKTVGGEVINVYTVTGQKVVDMIAKEGVNTVQTSQKGILLVKVANKVVKVIL